MSAVRTGYQSPVPLVLASASMARQKMLRSAGLVFDVEPAAIDEEDIKTAVLRDESVGGADLAQILAEAKADFVSGIRDDAVVIGSDQVLEFEGRVLSKPATMDIARQRLLALRGRSHELHAAAAICRDGVALWRHVETVRITMRDFTPEFLGQYMALAGTSVLGSVGGYEVEASGIHLMSRIDGDYFSVLGLPLVPVLDALRDLEVLAQ